MALLFQKVVFTHLERPKLCPIYNAHQTNTIGILLIPIKIIKKAPFCATRWQPFKGLHLKLLDCNPTLFLSKGSFYFDIKSDLKSYLTRFFKSSTKQYDVTLHTPDSKLFKGRHACLPLTRKKFGLTFSFASGRKHYFWQRETCQGLVTFCFQELNLV